MTNLTLAAQIIVSASVYYVWIFRYFNVVKEFNQFGLSDLTRNFVGATKITLSALIIVSIWHPELLAISSALMGLLMIGAQYFHFKIKNPFVKHLPSLLLLILCIFLTTVTSDLI
ncbi:DoxX family protein [Flavobacterium sp.]|uniref:DoxX family protein n=1 Tax=Flavobacterium sp. TaxID=239 RepID=UPI00286E175D|nr:DoxX family protein [Flavobacterium sp.]